MATKRQIALEEENERLRAALSRSIVAIDDWLHIYAHDLCDDDDVEKSRARVNAAGTLAYIAEVQEQNHAALKTT